MSEAIKTVGVLGAGQMGSGIAQVAAQAGVKVLLADAKLELAEAARARIVGTLEKLAEKGKLSAEAVAEAAGRLTAVGSLAELGSADLVIEAATENVELKLQLFRQLDAAAPKALLASNTSSISLTRIAGVVKDPTRVVGLHFFNPVPLMKLVEVIRALQTSDATYQAAVAFATSLNKTVVTAQDAPGFIVNRILLPLLNEAVFALAEGVGTVQDIDTGCTLGLNHPMGPLELADFIGLDTVLAIAEVLHTQLGDDKYRPAPLLRRYVAAGWLGRKSGRGFYRWEGGKKSPA